MKAIMGFGFFLLFLAGIALVTLQGRQMAQQSMGGGGAGLTGVEWRPAVIGNSLIEANSGMSISFDVDGSIKGNGGCNGFSGSLQQSDSGLEIGPLASTRMACKDLVMTREAKFLEAVQNTKGFQEGEDGVQLLGSDGEVLAELVDGSRD